MEGQIIILVLEYSLKKFSLKINQKLIDQI